MVCNTIPGTFSISAAPTALNLNFNPFPGLTAWATVVTRPRRCAQFNKRASQSSPSSMRVQWEQNDGKASRRARRQAYLDQNDRKTCHCRTF